jgi:lipid-binding SYLF domain-containing protein
VIEPDQDSTIAIYGKDKAYRDILVGSVAPPASAEPFLAAVKGASHKAAVSEAREPK